MQTMAKRQIKMQRNF